MVDSGEYLWECVKCVGLNRVRGGVVRHPREWDWSGYGELMGWRKRNPLLDLDRLLWLVRASTLDEFRAHFNATLDEALVNDELKRQEKWATALAVGSQGFVEAIERRLRNRQQMEMQKESGISLLREEYGSLWDGENASMGQFRL